MFGLCSYEREYPWISPENMAKNMIPSWIGVLKIQLKFSNFSRHSMCVQVNIPPFAQLERLLLRTAIGIWLLMKRQFTGILEYHRFQSKDHCCLEMWTHSTTINYIHLYTISGRLELFLFHDCRWKSSFSAWAVPFPGPPNHQMPRFSATLLKRV